MTSCRPQEPNLVSENYVSTLRSRTPLHQMWRVAPARSSLFDADPNRRVYAYGASGMQWGNGDWRLDRTDNGAFIVRTARHPGDLLWMRLATHRNHWHAPYDFIVDLDTGAAEIRYDNAPGALSKRRVISDVYWVTFEDGVASLGAGRTPGANPLVQLDNVDRHLTGYVDWGIGRLLKNPGSATNVAMAIDAIPLKRAYV